MIWLTISIALLLLGVGLVLNAVYDVRNAVHIRANLYTAKVGARLDDHMALIHAASANHERESSNRFDALGKALDGHAADAASRSSLLRERIDEQFAGVRGSITLLCAASAKARETAQAHEQRLDALGAALDEHAAELLDRLPVRAPDLPPVPELPQSLPWHPVSEVPPLLDDRTCSPWLPVLTPNGPRIGYWSSMDEGWVLGDLPDSDPVTHWLPLDALTQPVRSMPMPEVARAEKTVADIAAAVEAQHEAIREQVASHLRGVMVGAVSRLKAREVGEFAALQLRDAWEALQRERDTVKDLTKERDYLRREAARLNDALAKSHAEQDRLADALKAAEEQARARLGEVRANGDETTQRWLVLAHRRGQVLRDVRRALTVGAADESDALSRFCTEWAPRVEEGLSGEGEAIHVTPPVPALPWRPASEPPPVAAEYVSISLTVPVLCDGRPLCGFYQHNEGEWRIEDGEGTVTHWLPLEALQQTTESRPQPVATPETLGVRSQPGLARTLTAEAARVVEHAVAVLRPMVPGGEGLDPASLCAAVRATCDEADTALTEARVVTQKSGSHYTLGQRVVILAGRERAARADRDAAQAHAQAERDALRAQISEVMASRDAESQTTLRTMAGLRQQVQSLTAQQLHLTADRDDIAYHLAHAKEDAAGARLSLKAATEYGDRMAEQVRQIRAVAFDPQTSMPRKVAEIQHLLQHDGVEDPAVKPAPVTEFPHPTTGRDPLTATDAPPAEYAAEADALGVQS